ncbi:MAG: hypothetical protein J7521_21065 [Caulobacter sp.]|nr:hypothetical protein [Caulobacter sp.]
MDLFWTIAGDFWLICSAVVALLIIWDHAGGAPALPVRYELVMVALGPVTLLFAWIFSREDADGE